MQTLSWKVAVTELYVDTMATGGSGLGGIRVVFFFLLGFFAGILVITIALNTTYKYSLLRWQEQQAESAGPGASVFGVSGPALPVTLRRRGSEGQRATDKGTGTDKKERAFRAKVESASAPSDLNSIPSAPLAGTGDICSDVAVVPPDGVEAHKYTTVGVQDVDKAKYHCYPTNLKHWEFAHYHKQPPVPFCTHDPAVDKVISAHLSEYGWWGSPDEFRVLLSLSPEGGPCTKDRPYILDIGANIGLFSVIAAFHGCHAFAFEPLAENNHRLVQSLELNGVADRVRVFKHAVGRKYLPVTLGFRAGNPGSSGINLGGDSSETVEQITIDGLLAGPEASHWEGQAAVLGMRADIKDGKPRPEVTLPRLTGDKVNFVKIDTEGWDVAVFQGALNTIIGGGVPHLLVEFSPGDAKGTAKCSPLAFIDALYSAGYTMYEHGKAYSREAAEQWVVPHGLTGKGKRVWEAWFFKEEAAERLVELKFLKDRPSEAGNPEAKAAAKLQYD